MSLFLFLAIVTLSWGIGNVLVKKGFQKLSPWQTYALDAIFIAFPLWIGYGLLNAGNIKPVTPMAILSAVFVSIIYALFYYTINLGQIGLTSPIIATYPVFTLALAFLFLGERLNFMAAIGIFLALIGVILISLPSKIKFKLENWVYLSLLTSLGYGISGYLGKLAVDDVGNITYLVILAVTQVVVVLIWRLFVPDPIPKMKIKNIGFSFAGIVLFNLGNIVYYIALEKSLASIVVPLSNTYITIIAILSVLCLHEKISLLQLVGIGSVVAGVILVGFNI